MRAKALQAIRRRMTLLARPKKTRNPIRSSSQAISKMGDRVADSTWSWEFKLGKYYTDEDRFEGTMPDGEVKPVVWIVIVKDHFDGLPAHVTLMSEELIARYPYDDGEERLGVQGYRGTSYWPDSGTPDAEHGLRPFLNSLSKDEYAYTGDGFRAAFSDPFDEAVLETTIGHITKLDDDGNWDEENPWVQYTTQDHVFVLSTAEYGINQAEDMPEQGRVVPYFDPEHPAYPQDPMEAWERDMKTAHLGGEEYMYWSRTATRTFFNSVALASTAEGSGSSTPSSPEGVRPVLNLSGNVRVSEIPNDEGVYEITW